MPWAIPQFFDASGDPLTSGKLCVFSAGTSTLKNTYTTAALSVANANPVVMNAGGWPSSSGSIVGIFLEPGESYKFVLKASNATTCVPDTGTTIWSVDNVTAMPVDSGAIDIDGTAGEALVAGDVVYLSDGSGSRTVGRWYKADADTAAYSSEAPFIGMVTSSISSGATGTIRLKGLVTVSGVSASVVYYVSGTAGGVTATAPALIRNVGVGYTATEILLSPQNNGKLPTLGSAYVYNAIQLNVVACGRLTLTSGLPVTTADVTGASAVTVYYTPAGKCNQIGLYTTGSVWVARTFAELSISVPATTNTNYDVFAYDNAGVVALELSAAWNNSGAGTSARFASGTYASNLPMQDGVRVKSTDGAAIDATRRYLGTFRTTGVSGQTEDSFAKRFVWNIANQVPRPMRVLEATNSWTYNNAATYQQANASAANQLAFVIGVADVMLSARVYGQAIDSTGVIRATTAVGLDSATTPTSGNVFGGFTNNTVVTAITSALDVYPSIGYHFAAWLESAASVNTTTWYGDNNTPTVQQSGIHGVILG